MLFNTKGRFYDGKTSLPQNIEVFFDFKQGKLSFEIGLKKITWKNTETKFSKNNNNLICLYGDDPVQQIFISDPDFIKKAYPLLKSHGHQNWYDTLLELGLKAHTLIAFGILTAIILSYFYFIPWLGEKTVAIIPESYDIELGNMVYEQTMVTEEKELEKSKILNEFAKKLQLNNSKKLQFTVVKSETVNAFALPDGNIVVYTGILDKMKNYEELAALLGHEAAHVNHRHSMKSLCRDLSGYFFISAVLGDVNGVMAILGEHANNLQSLSFSRGFEKQSDEEGLKMMFQNQINPNGMIDLFSRLQTEEKETGISVPEFLSSHPVTIDRIKHIKDRIKKSKYTFKEKPELKLLFEKLKN
ncbi:M48 family metallopeptidase [Flavobacterium sp. H122]|uniref:M48 family metallopeptidase n=1 Tax=Flavobacterium sp. H122 TaxID=2529860 RepID=UPI0010A9EA10|nr:M48 family metallopeptidase [Flavobacterium sp. H122]